MDNSLRISFTSFLSFFSPRETNNLRVIWNHTKLACIDTLYILEIYTYSTIIEKENKWFLLLEKALLPLFLCKCPILVFFFLLLFFLSVLLPLSIFFHFQFLFFSPVLQFPMSFLVPPPSVPPEFADTLLQEKGQKNCRAWKDYSREWNERK